MITLNSPPVSRARKLATSAFLGVVSVSLITKVVLDFDVMREAWNAGDSLSFFYTLWFTLLSAVGAIVAVLQLIEYIRKGPKRQQIIATARSMVFKNRGEPFTIIKPSEVVGLARDGRILFLSDKTRFYVRVARASAKEINTFVDRLHDLWWPGLTRSEIKDILSRTRAF